MIDPENITAPMSLAKLQEFLLFAVSVAGHSAKSTASSLDVALRMLGWPREHSLPFDSIKHHSFLGTPLENVLKWSGIGCHSLRAKTFRHLAYSNLDLQTCTVEQLQRIWGIGPKTSRFFIMYTRPDEADNYAVLDTHVLRWLREQAIDAPAQTPHNEKKYRLLEQWFLLLAKQRGLTARELDEQIWKGAQV